MFVLWNDEMSRFYSYTNTDFTIIIIKQGTKRCSGVLIHEDIVITSANCIHEQFLKFGIENFFARTDYRSDSFSTSTHTVTDMVNKPGFSPNHNSLSNDVVVLRLNRTADVPVAILNSDLPINNGDMLEAVGAGPTTNGSTVWSTSLLKRDILVQDFDDCRDGYREADRRVVLSESIQFCAGGPGLIAGGVGVFATIRSYLCIIYHVFRN
jgi:secreted trypsin-like serine protease